MVNTVKQLNVGWPQRFTVFVWLHVINNFWLMPGQRSGSGREHVLHSVTGWSLTPPFEGPSPCPVITTHTNTLAARPFTATNKWLTPSSRTLQWQHLCLQFRYTVALAGRTLQMTRSVCVHAHLLSVWRRSHCLHHLCQPKHLHSCWFKLRPLVFFFSTQSRVCLHAISI